MASNQTVIDLMHPADQVRAAQEEWMDDWKEQDAIKTLKEVMTREIKDQESRTQLVLDSLYRSDEQKAKAVNKLERLRRALAWLERQATQ